MPEVIYVLTNEAMPGLIKIGITSGDVSERVKQLDTTSIPLPSYRQFLVTAEPVRRRRLWADGQSVWR